MSELESLAASDVTSIEGLSSSELSALLRDLRGDREIVLELEKVERKPPMYKLFRRTIYGLYGLAALWILVAVTIAAWQGVWGERGQALLHAEEQPRSVTVTEDRSVGVEPRSNGLKEGGVASPSASPLPVPAAPHSQPSSAKEE